jgi:Caudovirus prohead serine protease
MNYSWLEPGHYVVNSHGQPVKQNVATKSRAEQKKVIQGYAALYGEKNKHWYKGRWEAFESNCFAGSIWGVWLGRDHKYTERKIAEQDNSSLEILETEVGLAFRAKLKPGDLEWIDGRSEVSVAYVEKDVEVRNGIRFIKSAALLEISVCHVATLRKSHAIVCDADSVGTLAEDAKSRFETDAAATKFLAALKRCHT